MPEDEDDDSYWQSVEGTARPHAQDAGHWVRVYTELLAGLNEMQPRDAPNLRLQRRIATVRARLEYWEQRLRNPNP